MTIHALLVGAAWLFYAVCILGVMLVPGSVTFSGLPVRSPILRACAVIVVFPMIGVVFWLIGQIGTFLLLPIRSIFF